MIKVVEFKGTPVRFGIIKYLGNGEIVKRLVEREETALDQLNEYLAINNKEIDLIEVQTHRDRFMLVYRERSKENI